MKKDMDKRKYQEVIEDCISGEFYHYAEMKEGAAGRFLLSTFDARKLDESYKGYEHQVYRIKDNDTVDWNKGSLCSAIGYTFKEALAAHKASAVMVLEGKVPHSPWDKSREGE